VQRIVLAVFFFFHLPAWHRPFVYPLPFAHGFFLYINSKHAEPSHMRGRIAQHQPLGHDPLHSDIWGVFECPYARLSFFQSDVFSILLLNSNKLRLRESSNTSGPASQLSQQYFHWYGSLNLRGVASIHMNNYWVQLE